MILNVGKYNCRSKFNRIEKKLKLNCSSRWTDKQVLSINYPVGKALYVIDRIYSCRNLIVEFLFNESTVVKRVVKQMISYEVHHIIRWWIHHRKKYFYTWCICVNKLFMRKIIVPVFAYFYIFLKYIFFLVYQIDIFDTRCSLHVISFFIIIINPSEEIPLYAFHYVYYFCVNFYLCFYGPV